MALQERFTHTVYCVDLDGGGIYILPDEQNIAMLTAGTERAQERLSELEIQIAGEKDKKKLAALEVEIEQTKLVISQYEQDADDLKAFIKKWRPVAKKHTIQMHVASFNEERLARTQARAKDETGEVDQGDYALILLAKCIEGWSLEEKCSEEAIGSLPGALVENLYAALVAPTSPSPARLRFPGDSAPGPTERKPDIERTS